MVEYKCLKCNKIFIRKSNYESHLRRKTDCNKLLNFDIILRSNTLELRSNTLELRSDNDEIMCHNCNKKFKQKRYLTEHIKKICIKKQLNNDVIKLNEEIIKLKEEMIKLKNKKSNKVVKNDDIVNNNNININNINNNINIRNIDNKTINITVNSLGRENIDHFKNDQSVNF